MSAVGNRLDALRVQERQRSRQIDRVLRRRQRRQADRMSRTLDFVHVDSSAFEFSSMNVSFGEVLRVALASLWRRKLLIGATVVAALALGIVAAILIPPSYTPEAYIRGGFVASTAVAKDQDSKSAPSVGLDLMRVIETQSRLLENSRLGAPGRTATRCKAATT